MSKLVIIDGNAVLHRAFHAMPALATRNGEPINAVYGLVSMFLRIIQDLRPDAIAVCFDEKEKTFRHKEFEKYQAQRPPTHDDLLSQFEKARAFFKAVGVPVYSKPGYEADDIIGTIADQATRGEIENPDREKQKNNSQDSISNLNSFDNIVIVTGDRDLLQLVDDKKGVKLYMPINGLSNAKLYNSVTAEERMGVPPSQISDLKALVGDASDNYPGVSGIGPKTAQKLLKDYQSIDNIYTHLDDISPNIRTKLVSGKDQAKLFHRIATVVRNVPIKIDFPQMSEWKIDSTEVLKLFQDFGFRTLSERIKKVGKEIEESKQHTLF